MTGTNAEKKWYSADDVELAKAALEELPDLTKTRLTKASVLDELKPQIVMLAESKGYSAEDIKSALETVGITVGLKSIRDMISARKKPQKTAKKRAVAQRENADTGSQNKQDSVQA